MTLGGSPAGSLPGVLKNPHYGHIRVCPPTQQAISSSNGNGTEKLGKLS
jgi:hypothetical protein